MNPYDTLAMVIRRRNIGMIGAQAGAVRPLRGGTATWEPTRTTPPVWSPARAVEALQTTGKTLTQFSNTIKTNNLTAASRNNSRRRAGRAQGTSTRCSRCSGRRTYRRIRPMRSSSRAYRVSQNNLRASVSRGTAPIKSRPSRTGDGAHPRALN